MTGTYTATEYIYTESASGLPSTAPSAGTSADNRTEFCCSPWQLPRRVVPECRVDVVPGIRRSSRRSGCSRRSWRNCGRRSRCLRRRAFRPTSRIRRNTECISKTRYRLRLPPLRHLSREHGGKSQIDRGDGKRVEPRCPFKASDTMAIKQWLSDKKNIPIIAAAAVALLVVAGVIVAFATGLLGGKSAPDTAYIPPGELAASRVPGPSPGMPNTAGVPGRPGMPLPSQMGQPRQNPFAAPTALRPPGLTGAPAIPGKTPPLPSAATIASSNLSPAQKAVLIRNMPQMAALQSMTPQQKLALGKKMISQMSAAGIKMPNIPGMPGSSGAAHNPNPFTPTVNVKQLTALVIQPAGVHLRAVRFHHPLAQFATRLDRISCADARFYRSGRRYSPAGPGCRYHQQQRHPGDLRSRRPRHDHIAGQSVAGKWRTRPIDPVRWNYRSSARQPPNRSSAYYRRISVSPISVGRRPAVRHAASRRPNKPW